MLLGARPAQAMLPSVYAFNPSTNDTASQRSVVSTTLWSSASKWIWNWREWQRLRRSHWRTAVRSASGGAVRIHRSVLDHFKERPCTVSWWVDDPATVLP